MNDEKNQFRVTSFFGDDEFKLLSEFKNLLETHFSKPANVLCAHNGKEFDFPFIARRMIVHQIPLPKKLNLFGWRHLLIRLWKLLILKILA